MFSASTQRWIILQLHAKSLSVKPLINTDAYFLIQPLSTSCSKWISVILVRCDLWCPAGHSARAIIFPTLYQLSMTLLASYSHRSRLLEMAPFDRSLTSSYSPCISNCIVCEIELLVENREFFIPHLYLAPPQGVTPSEFPEDV